MINTIFLNPEGSLQPTSIPRCELYPLILAILAWPNSILAHSASSLGLILYDTHLHVYTFDRNKETSELNVSFIPKITILSQFRFWNHKCFSKFRFSEWHTIQIGQMNQIIIKYWD